VGEGVGNLNGTLVAQGRELPRFPWPGASQPQAVSGWMPEVRWLDHCVSGETSADGLVLGAEADNGLRSTLTWRGRPA
jgi:hypothetical protein